MENVMYIKKNDVTFVVRGTMTRLESAEEIEDYIRSDGESVYKR